MYYAVFENDIPASSEGYPHLTKDCWETHEFETLEEAIKYAHAWVGATEELPDDMVPGEPYKIGGYGDYIIIRIMQAHVK